MITIDLLFRLALGKAHVIWVAEVVMASAIFLCEVNFGGGFLIIWDIHLWEKCRLSAKISVGCMLLNLSLEKQIGQKQQFLRPLLLPLLR